MKKIQNYISLFLFVWTMLAVQMKMCLGVRMKSM